MISASLVRALNWAVNSLDPSRGEDPKCEQVLLELKDALITAEFLPMEGPMMFIDGPQLLDRADAVALAAQLLVSLDELGAEP